jgi:AcrR family transcriptional regulator
MPADRIAQRVPRSLPRCRNPAPRHVVLLSQRTRLLEGVFAAVAERGYAATTVAEITRIASVSRATFYEQFSDKLDCFLAAYRAAGDELYAAVRDASSLVETVAAGPRALELREMVDGRFVVMLRGTSERLRETRPGLPELEDDMVRLQLAVLGVPS